MDAIKKFTDEVSEATCFRISLSSRNPKDIEKATLDLIARAHVSKTKVTVKGPIRLPTRTLKHTTRKSPCGNGTNTWDTYEMKIYKRIIDLYTTKESACSLTQIDLPTGVDVSVRIS